MKSCMAGRSLVRVSPSLAATVLHARRLHVQRATGHLITEQAVRFRITLWRLT